VHKWDEPLADDDDDNFHATRSNGGELAETLGESLNINKHDKQMREKKRRSLCTKRPLKRPLITESGGRRSGAPMMAIKLKDQMHLPHTRVSGLE
jgi:hypothetical protein